MHRQMHTSEGARLDLVLQIRLAPNLSSERSELAICELAQFRANSVRCYLTKFVCRLSFRLAFHVHINSPSAHLLRTGCSFHSPSARICVNLDFRLAFHVHI
jgi:hypothetical protein